MNIHNEEKDEGYWCVVCQKFLPAQEGVIVHDNVFHPEMMNFSDDNFPQ